MHTFKRILTALLVVLLLALAGAAVWVYPREPEPPLPAGTREPVFEEPAAVFTHRWDREHGYHLMGGAAIDVDGDGRHEVFVSGGHGQPDALLGHDGRQLVDRIAATGLSDDSAASYGAASIDLEGDGDEDLFVARETGVTLYRNDGKGVFSAEPLPLSLPEHSVVLAVALADVDRDGDADAYLSVFIDAAHLKSATYNDPAHVRHNLLLQNDGEGGWKDISDEVTRGKQNTFSALFADLDSDGWPDLVLAQNTGELEILRNDKGRFEAVKLQTGYGFWMGIGVGDVDNDGDLDLFASNAGNSVPAQLTRGDLRDDQAQNLEWILLRNDGDMTFVDITKDSGLQGYGFGWGAAFDDVNLDGRLDLAVAENYIKWPVHSVKKLPGKILLNVKADGPSFFPAKAGTNGHYGHSPMFVDLDADGRHDLLWLNANGPARVLLNRTEGRFLTVQLPDTVASLGARVTLDGTQVHPTGHVTSGAGLTTDPPPSFMFGLGPDETPSHIVVTWPGGGRTLIDEPEPNTRVRVKP